MTNLTMADFGWHQVEINNGAQEQGYAVTVIREVPRPAVFFGPALCFSTSEKCQLTCEGNTREAEPVSYSWRRGDGEWERSTKLKPEHHQEKLQPHSHLLLPDGEPGR